DLALEGPRGTVVRAADAGAGPRDVVIDVVDHDQVEPAVSVVVHEGARGAPAVVLQSRLLGDLPELAVALVEEQADATVLGDQDVGQAIVVDVAHRHAYAVPGEIQARALAHVPEGAVGLLPEELVGPAFGSTVVEQV